MENINTYPDFIREVLTQAFNRSNLSNGKIKLVELTDEDMEKCETQKQKETLVAHLEANKIQTRNYFAGNILLHPGFRHLDDAEKYPLANKALSHVFLLGCPPFWNDAVFDYIEKVVKNVT